MRTARRLAVFQILIGLFACGYALADGKSTVDPNVNGASTPKPEAEPDVRLEQKVSYEAQFKTVREILEDLSKMSGVKFTAGSNSWDWQVRSRKMNIFVKNVRLADMMNSVAHTMKFAWAHNDDLNPPTYRLVVNCKAAAAADIQRMRAEKRSEELARARRTEWLEIIERDGAMSESQVESLRTSDPIIYRYARQGDLKALQALFKDCPEAKSAFAAGRNFRISVNKLNPKTHSMLFSAADEFVKFLQMSRGHEPTGLGNTFKQSDKVDMAYCRLDVGSFTPNLRWSFYTQGSTGYFHLARDEKDWQIVDLKDRNSAWSRALCERENKVIDGLDPKASRAELMTHIPELEAINKKDEDLLYPNEPLIEHPDSLEMEKVAKLELDLPKKKQDDVMTVNEYIAAFQKAIFEATGLGIVSDSWVNIKGGKLPEKKAKLSELLEQFGSEFNYNWDKRGDIIEFRHRKWWKNRLNQIPDEWVTAWSTNTRKNGFISLDDIAKISNLTYEQAEESLRADQVIGVRGIYDLILEVLDKNGNLHCLRLYSLLDSQQQALLKSADGLSEQMLTADQWRPAQYIFDRIGSPRAEAVFRMERISADDDTSYRFKEIDTASGEEDRTWVVRLPRYVAPAEVENAKP